MPLSREQFSALRAKGLSVDQIARFEKGDRPQGDPWSVPHAGGPAEGAIDTNPLLDPTSLIGLLFGGPVAGAARNLATSGGKAAAGAASKVALPKGSGQAIMDILATIEPRIAPAARMMGRAGRLLKLTRPAPAPAAAAPAVESIASPLGATVGRIGGNDIPPDAIPWLMQQLGRTQ